MKYLVTNEAGSTDIYILSSPNEVYMFEKSKAVEFLAELKQQYDYSLTTVSNFYVIAYYKCLNLWFLLYDKCHPSTEIEIKEI